MVKIIQSVQIGGLNSASQVEHQVCGFVDRRLKLAVKIGDRESILFSKLTVSSLNVMA